MMRAITQLTNVMKCRHGYGGALAALSADLVLAQHLVQERYMFRDHGHYCIEFNITHLHPQ